MALAEEAELSTIRVGRQRLTFERQLDFVLQWWKAMYSQQMRDALELLVSHCHNSELKFLSTVLEPTYHRDFLYSAQRRYPDREFRPVSTPISRETRSKLQNSLRAENRLLYRPQSALLTSVEDVRHLVQQRRPRSLSPSVLRSSDDNAYGPRQPKLHVSSMIGVHPQRERHRSISIQSAPLCDHRCSSSLPRRHMLSPDLGVDYWSEHSCAKNGSVNRRCKSAVSEISHTSRNSACSMLEYRHYKSESPPTTDVIRGNIKESTDPEIISSDVQTPARFPTVIQTIHWFNSNWTEAERITVLREIVTLLEDQELYHLAGLLAVTQSQDFVSQLPEDISVKVMCFLPPKDLVAVQKVSRKWHQLGSNEKVWKQKCQEVIISVSIDKFSTWKELFRHNALTVANRRSGKCRVKRLPAHRQGILCCKVNGFQVATGSLDKTIMLWDMRTGQHLKTLTGHLRGVWSVAFLDQTLLVSASHDHTIKVWNLRTSNCERTLMGHAGPVWTVAVKNNVLVTGSQDKTVRIWDTRNCSCTWKVTSHTGPVFCVDITEDATLALSGSGDKTIRMWDVEKGYCIRVLKASSTHSVMSISYSKGFLASCCSNVVSLWDVNKAQRLHTFTDHKKRVEAVRLCVETGGNEKWHGTIASCGKDMMVKYWDINEGRCLQTFKGHTDTVSSVHLDGTRIISVSHDQTIRFWNFQT